jgi:hypothetical protein
MSTLLRFVAFVLLIPAVASAQDGRIQLEILDKLAARASEKQEIAIGPESLTSVAPSLVPPGPKADAVKQVLAKLRGIFVRHYEFDDPKAYSIDDFNTIRKQLTAPGWTRIVANEEKDKNGSWEVQEIYIFQREGRTNGIVVLSAEPQELSVVNIVGPIEFGDIVALAGVLGIPHIAGLPR